MANTGYIKLHRKIDNWRYHPSVTGRKFTKYEAWIEFLKKANHTGRKVGNIDLSRGQFITSQESLSRYFRWSRGKVRRFIMDLELGDENGPEIIQKTDGKMTIITICNYETYQGRRTDNVTGFRPSGGTTESHQTDITNKLKNDKNEKEELPLHSIMEQIGMSEFAAAVRPRDSIEWIAFLTDQYKPEYIREKVDHLNSVWQRKFLKPPRDSKTAREKITQELEGKKERVNIADKIAAVLEAE